MTITKRLVKGSALTFAEMDGNITEIEERVVGPASSTDSNLAAFDGTDGLLIKDSGIALSTVVKTSTSQTDFISGIIQTPANQDYLIVVNSPIAFTVTAITTKCVSGTCTLTGKIDGVALGGSANSVSSSEVTQAHASSNAVAAGNDLTLTVSSNSACSYLSFTVKFTRALA